VFDIDEVRKELMEMRLIMKLIEKGQSLLLVLLIVVTVLIAMMVMM